MLRGNGELPEDRVIQDERRVVAGHDGAAQRLPGDEDDVLGLGRGREAEHEEQGAEKGAHGCVSVELCAPGARGPPGAL